jgi:hypothetical protein
MALTMPSNSSKEKGYSMSRVVKVLVSGFSFETALNNLLMASLASYYSRCT